MEFDFPVRDSRLEIKDYARQLQNIQPYDTENSNVVVLILTFFSESTQSHREIFS